MEQKRLNTQLLLEIALSQNPDGDIEDILQKTLPVYLKKLGCFAAAVIHDGNLRYIQPAAMLHHSNWKSAQKKIEQELETNRTEITELVEGDFYYYSYPLADYGRLILAKKRAFPKELKFELKKIIHQLGKNLQFVSQQQEVTETRQKLESIFKELEDVV